MDRGLARYSGDLDAERFGDSNEPMNPWSTGEGTFVSRDLVANYHDLLLYFHAIDRNLQVVQRGQIPREVRYLGR